MARKEETKTVLERQYLIPIKRRTLGVPKYRKAKKAVITVREFISKHMKSEDVSIGKYLNEHIWRHGMKNPPGKVKVTASKNSEGKVVVELCGSPKEQPKEDKKGKNAEEAKKAVKEKPKKEITKEAEIIKEEVKEKKEHKAEEAKKIEHEEIKELRKEHPHQHSPKMPKEQKSQELRKKELIPPQRSG